MMSCFAFMDRSLAKRHRVALRGLVFVAMFSVAAVGLEGLAFGQSAPTAVSLNVRYQAGMEALRGGHYAAARDSFEAIVADGYGSASLYDNLGYTYYRLDDIGRAVLNYERAGRAGMDPARVSHNLAIARSRLDVDEVRFSPPPPDRIRAAVRSLVPYGVLVGFGIGLVWIGVVVGLLPRCRVEHPLVARLSRWSRGLRATCLVLGLVHVAFGLWLSWSSELNQEAIVIAKEAPMYAYPDTTQVVVTLRGGRAVFVGERVGPWVSVRLGDGQRGVVVPSAVESVFP